MRSRTTTALMLRIPKSCARCINYDDWWKSFSKCQIPPPRKHKSKHWWWKWQISLLRLTRTISYREFEIVHHCFPVIVPIFENVPRHDLVGDLTVLIYITLRHTYISEYTNVELHYNSWITWHNNSNGFVQKTYTQHCLVIPCADIVFNYSDCLCVMAPVPLLVMQTFHRLLLPSNISDSDGISGRSTTNDTHACSANLQFFLFLSCTETVTPSYSKWSIRYCSHCNIDDSDGYNIPHNW